VSQKNIDFGTFPDDPNADAIRTAFTKVQENFTELFENGMMQGVQSINRTAQPGITVNNTTGNVLITANIAQVQVQTSSLALGVSSPGTLLNATITSSGQSLYIDLPANTTITTSLVVGNNTSNTAITNGNITTTGNITATNINSGNLLTANYVTGTLTTGAQPNITSVGTLANLTVSGLSNLGPVSNVTITGGSSGYVLSTNGSGALSWVIPDSGATGATGLQGATGATGVQGDMGQLDLSAQPARLD